MDSVSIGMASPSMLENKKVHQTFGGETFSIFPGGQAHEYHCECATSRLCLCVTSEGTKYTSSSSGKRGVLCNAMHKAAVSCHVA
eukprot:1675486-Amphidinium_carterae.1